MAPYARLEVTVTLALGLLATVGVALLAGWWALLPALLAAALLSFYRDPPRRVPAGDDLVLAPADGKLVSIEHGVPGPDGQPMLRLLIFLSVFNVHINRSPCAGRVTAIDYRPGEFVNALRTDADDRNECNRLTLAPQALPGPIHVRQIAGVLARRIVCVARIGQTLAAGERFGMIKLGSRTELLLPEDPRWELRVALHDRVRAGATVLARLRTEPASDRQA
jgi:phosphatidylserine decarboxylase